MFSHRLKIEIRENRIYLIFWVATLAIEAASLGFTEKEILSALKEAWKTIQKNS